jgi:PIN domain nuclease of toxin-antitoxin system
MIRDDSELLLSIGSCWELAIKHSLGKLELRRPFEEFLPSALAKNAIELLPITLSHLSAVVQLPFHHRDPFDRLLVAQAQVEKIPLVSADGAIDAYGVVRIW